MDVARFIWGGRTFINHKKKIIYINDFKEFKKCTHIRRGERKKNLLSELNPPTRYLNPLA